jgi:hypothetical protein
LYFLLKWEMICTTIRKRSVILLKLTLVPKYVKPVVSICQHVEDQMVPGYIFGFLISF